ncbi:pterin-4-alpha-carbinolamine dehydratase 2, mitochondrial-like isoform X3 [Neltuma alba]|uniref:pterin-4-alpha-carbinolamine dehydratase 2, mitochondrial-like isoform X3 n=1 Tax=Neltuma alba TaxID=207710 RepID=UPI0010A5488F|nr:pterin-4-alpha-carbinolamine dehydratase 2, mitochondrial-like isoform X3 [Prosopis alba]
MNRFLQLPLLSSPNLKASFAPLFEDFLRSDGCLCSRVIDIPKDQVGVSSNKSLPRFRTYCTSKDLLIKKCVPCNTKELRPMTDGVADSLMPQVAGWNLVKEDGIMKLRQSWKVKSFTKGLELFKIVADLAENEGHHPDLHLVGWNNVTIEIWTHAVGILVLTGYSIDETVHFKHKIIWSVFIDIDFFFSFLSCISALAILSLSVKQINVYFFLFKKEKVPCSCDFLKP